MNAKKNPFPNKLPRFVRIQMYRYHFTGSTNNIDTESGVKWWSRELVKEYMPPISLDHQGVKDYLSNIGILDSKKKNTKLKDTNQSLKRLLDIIRFQALQVEPHIIVWTISLALLPIFYSVVRRC